MLSAWGKLESCMNKLPNDQSSNCTKWSGDQVAPAQEFVLLGCLEVGGEDDVHTEQGSGVKLPVSPVKQFILASKLSTPNDKEAWRCWNVYKWKMILSRNI